MILANVDWLSVSITLLLIVFVIVCLLMSLLILMQRPKQEGLGAAFGSGMTDQMFGARTTNVLQRGTVYLGSLFFILTITLAILYARKNERTYSMKKDEPVVVEEVVVEDVEETPAGSLEDELETTPIGGGDAPVTDDPAAGEVETDEGEASDDGAAENLEGEVRDLEELGTPVEEDAADAPAEDAAAEGSEAPEQPAGDAEEQP
jgi:preprotein translocase subunit SecG